MAVVLVTVRHCCYGYHGYNVTSLRGDHVQAKTDTELCLVSNSEMCYLVNISKIEKRNFNEMQRIK